MQTTRVLLVRHGATTLSAEDGFAAPVDVEADRHDEGPFADRHDEGPFPAEAYLAPGEAWGRGKRM